MAQPSARRRTCSRLFHRPRRPPPGTDRDACAPIGISPAGGGHRRTLALVKAFTRSLELIVLLTPQLRAERSRPYMGCTILRRVAAWIVEKFRSWSYCNGDVETRFTRDEVQ